MAKQWHLSLEGYDIPTNKVVSLNIGRKVSEDEVDAIDEATKFLQEIVDDSPYIRLDEEYQAFKNCIHKITDGIANKSQNPNDIKEVSKQLDSLLTALRAFDDRTKHNLSQRYGNTSKPFKVFSEALSYEYDNSFAYRFCCQLRNYSQHVGSTISNIEAGGDIQGRVFCNPTFNSSVLLSKYERWNSRVKNELKQINGDFPVIPIINQLMLSCTRAYSKFLLEDEKNIRSAIEVINKYSEEMPAKSARPLLIQVDVDNGNSDYTKMELKYLKQNLSKNAESMLRQAKTFVNFK